MYIFTFNHKCYSQRYAANILCFFHQNCDYIHSENHQSSPRPSATSSDSPIDDKTKADVLLIYPNPAGNYTSFAWNLEKHEDNLLIEIFDIRGNRIKSHPINSPQGEWTLDTRQYVSGLYTCRLSVNGKEIKSQVFVVKQ